MGRSAVIGAFLLLSFWLGDVRGFPDGAPISTCDNNVPHHHGTEPTWTPTPYRLSRDRGSYSPGDVISLTLDTPVNKHFEGFQIVAKPVTGDTTMIVGTFIDPPAGAKLQQWYSPDNTTNCITHQNKKHKTSVTVKWRAPSQSVGDIMFFAGVVHEFHEFWTNLTTIPVKATVPDTRVNRVEPLRQFKPELNIDECGKTKGCLWWPKTCSYDSCQVVVSYRTVSGGQFVDFEVMADSEEYVAVGFSYDLLMGNDEVFICVHTPYVKAVQRTYSPERHNHVHRLEGVSNMQLKREGSRVYCRFRRPIVLSLRHNNQNVVFDLNDDFYLQVAYGRMYSRTSSAHKHSALPLVSQTKVDFQSISIVRGQRLYRELQAHVFFTLTAWLLLAGVAKLMPSALKSELKQLVLGAGLWFQLHRAIATVIAVFTTIAIILIFAHLKAVSKSGLAHAICGLVVTALMLMQILAGILRPDKGAPKRQLWYYLHFLLGHGTHFMAAVTAIVAANTKLFDPQFQTSMSAIFACWLVVQLLWDIGFVVRRLWEERNKSEKPPQAEEEDLQKLEVEDVPRKTPSNVIRVMAVCYVACLLAFYIAALYFIFSW